MRRTVAFVVILRNPLSPRAISRQESSDFTIPIREYTCLPEPVGSSRPDRSLALFSTSMMGAGDCLNRLLAGPIFCHPDRSAPPEATATPLAAWSAIEILPPLASLAIAPLELPRGRAHSILPKKRISLGSEVRIVL